LEKLRIEADSNLSRAEAAEQEVKAITDQLTKKDTMIQDLNNKIKLLQDDLERTEKRVNEVSNGFKSSTEQTRPNPERRRN
jgi:tropomyosin